MKNNSRDTNAFADASYEVPKGNSDYMKFEKGESKFRILSKPIFGWEGWKDKKPLRFRMESKPDSTQKFDQDIKHFIAVIVWDYSDSKIKILEITQKSVIEPIINLSRDADWGSPYEYDIKVIKKGEGMETEYSVSPVPHRKIENEIVDAFISKPILLDALYDGKDPFEKYGEKTGLNNMTL